MQLDIKLTGPVLILLSILLIGTVFYHLEEKWSWLDSLYFSSATLTTVGYGEIYPTTDGSKAFTILYLLTGVPMALYILVNLFAKAAETKLLKIEGSVLSRRDKKFN